MKERRSSLVRIRKFVDGIEKILNEPIPGTPRISPKGRVMYVALPGSKRKSRNVLSHRAQQVLARVNRTGRATAGALMDALEVNRNVIAGAVHELKQAGFLRTKAVADFQSAAEYRPRMHKARKARK